MKLDYILELPLDIQIMIYTYYKEAIDKDKNMILQFHNIPQNNIYFHLNRLIKKYELIIKPLLLEKVLLSFKQDTYVLYCLKQLTSIS